MLRTPLAPVLAGVAIALAFVLSGCGEDAAPPTTVPNTPPVADAGPDQAIVLPGTVTLDGSDSDDADGDALTYQWTLLAIPNGSAAALSDATMEAPAFDADVVGDYVARLIVNDGTDDSAPDTVTVTLGPTPTLQPFSRTIGDGLQFEGNAGLSAAGHGGVTVRIESDNPLVALVAPNASTPGSAFIDVDVADGIDFASYIVQGVAGAAGNVTVTVSSPGFTSGNGQIDIVEASLEISGLDTAQDVGTDDAFTIRTGPLNTAGTALDGFQGVSAAIAPPAVLTVTSSNGTVGQVRDNGTAGATIMIDLPAGTFQQDVTFEPLSNGATTVSASIPGFVSLPSAMVNVTVGLPGISPFSRRIGAGLQFAGNADLDIANHGGVTVRIESGDPAVALVAPDVTTPGSAFIDVAVMDGVDVVPYVVQAVADTTGVVTVTASAPGFANGMNTIDVVAAGIQIFGLVGVQSVGINDVFAVRTGPVNAMGTAVDGFQGASAANIPPLSISLASTDGGVGQVSYLANTGAAIMFNAGANEFQWSITFVPLAPGPTSVSASLPGFASFGSPVDITVDPPNIAPFSRTIGAGLQFGGAATLDIDNHGGVTVRIESDDPAVALIAPDAMTAGSAFIDVFVADGEATAPYVVQGVANTTGTVTVTASAPGFDSGTGSISIVQPGVVISGLATDQSVGVSDVFAVFVGVPNGGGTALSAFQGASAANSPPVLTISSNNGAVGEVSAGGNTGAVVMIDLTARVFQPGATFVPNTSGMTSVSASIPGFLSTTGATVNITVNP